jgi:hypothetical protein
MVNSERRKLFLTAAGALAVALAAMLALRNIAPTSPRSNEAVSHGAVQHSLSQSGVPDSSPSAIKGDPDIVKKMVQRHDEQMAARRGHDTDTAETTRFTTMADYHELMEEEPGVKKFMAMSQVTSITPGETIIMGGWSPEAGQRILVFVTPNMVDSAGNKATPPFGPQTQIAIDSKFVSAPDETIVNAGLQSLLTDQNDSGAVVRCSESDVRSKIEALEQSQGSQLLGAPRATTQAGCQACISMQNTVMIAGKNHAVGSFLNVLPTVAADGVSVDLTSIAGYATPNPGAADAGSQ